jgi:hypothetical protein
MAGTFVHVEESPGCITSRELVDKLSDSFSRSLLFVVNNNIGFCFEKFQSRKGWERKMLTNALDTD